jgi:hypothetical protein
LEAGPKQARLQVLWSLLPYLRSWAHLSAQLFDDGGARRIDLPVFQEWFVEVVLAGGAARPVAVGRHQQKNLAPTNRILVSPTQRVYRENAEVQAALVVQQAERRVGPLLEAIPALKNAAGGLAKRLGGRWAEPDLDASVDGLGGKLNGEARRKRHWYLAIERPRDGDSDLWDIASVLAERLPALRVVRFGGSFGADGELRALIDEVETLLSEVAEPHVE